MQYIGTQRSQLEHFIVGDLIDLERIGNDAGVGGVDALHIGVDLAEIGIESGCQCHCTGIRTAPSQGGDISVLVDALETGHDDDVALIQFIAEPLGVDAAHPGSTMGTVGMDTGLPAGQRNGRHTQPLQSQRHQRHGSQLAGGHQRIQLPLGRVGVDLLGLCDEVVGGFALCRYNHDHLVALAVCIGNDACHMGDLLGICHRAATEFLYNQCHTIFPPCRSRSGHLPQGEAPAPSSRASPAHPGSRGLPTDGVHPLHRDQSHQGGAGTADIGGVSLLFVKEIKDLLRSGISPSR